MLGAGRSDVFVGWVPIHLSMGIFLRFGSKDPQQAEPAKK
jgi:hypothetical protein